MKLNVTSKVIYPGHGVATVQGIETKHIMNNELEFYLMKIDSSGLSIIMPVNKCEIHGIRPIIQGLSAREVGAELNTVKASSESNTWIKRHREYMDKIRSGNFNEIKSVAGELIDLRKSKVLSFGERKMLDLALGLIIEEISASSGLDSVDVEGELNSQLTRL